MMKKTLPETLTFESPWKYAFCPKRKREFQPSIVRCELLVSGRVVITEMYWNAANKIQRRTFCLERVFEIVTGFKLNFRNSYNTYYRCQIKDHGWYPANENCLARQLKYPHGIGKVIFSNHQLLGAFWSVSWRLLGKQLPVASAIFQPFLRDSETWSLNVWGLLWEMSRHDTFWLKLK